MRAIENGKGKGHDASSWQETVQEAYQAAHQRLDELQQGAAEAIMRNLHGYEDHEVTQSRAGLSAQKEAAPSPETGQYTSPLPSGGIEHLDLSAVGKDPAMVWRMPEGVGEAPAWPVVIGDGAHYAITDRKGNPTGRHGGHGRLHIAARHQEDMERAGFTNVDNYVRHLLENATEIRQSRPRNGKDDGSFFVIKMGNDTSPTGGHGTVVLHLLRKDGYYRVATAGGFAREYLEGKSLLDGRRPPSRPNGRTTGPTDNMATKADNHARIHAIRHSDILDNGNLASKSQAITEAQTYSDQIDRQLAALGDQISPEELAEVQREKTLSDGNVDALTSAAACLTRKAP